MTNPRDSLDPIIIKESSLYLKSFNFKDNSLNNNISIINNIPALIQSNLLNIPKIQGYKHFVLDSSRKLKASEVH